MEYASHAVPAEVAHDSTSLPTFGIGLNGVPDVAGGCVRFHGGNAAHHRFIGDVHKPPCFELDVSDQIHAAGVAVPAVDNHGHIDVDDIAVPQRLFVGNSVAHHMVDGGAEAVALS